MRGKHSHTAQVRVEEALIPANAGKTGRHCPPWGPTGAHPRSRGENAVLCVAMRAAGGSSPLMRGKPHASRSPRDRRRLIPAHAGKHRAGEFGLDEAGLIPAHAGKTLRTGSRRRCRGAHPRSCRENPVGTGPRRRGLGSSPLTRGKRRGCLVAVNDDGLIPAHAGKTACRTARLCCGRAHPHSRGEDVAVLIAFMVFLGSSPPTRGKRRGRRRSHLPARLIPAHAGKTLPDLRFYRADRSDLGKP